MTVQPGVSGGEGAAVRAAIVLAACMIAHQVAAKATRDALFLGTFAVTALPVMFAGAAAGSLLLGRAAASAMVRRGPGRLLPGALLGSALMLLLEAAVYRFHRPAAAIAIYLHVAVLGALLVSGFWSLFNERFDPRTAKRVAGRVAAGATVGGIAGGVVAERVAGHGGLDLMLPLLALSHLGCAWVGHRFVALGGSISAADMTDPRASASRIVARDPYLRQLAMLVAAAAVATALVDYVFKVRAVEAFGRGPALMRFFATFHASVGVATLLVQLGLARRLLEHVGLARTLALLPGAVAAGSVCALAAPGLLAAALLRGVESVARHGLFRSGYEILYTPVAAGAKRRVKGLVDVTLERLADMAGGAIVQVVLWAAPLAAGSVLLALAIGFCALAAVLAANLQRGYVEALRGSLERRAIDLDLDDLGDATTRSAVMMTLGTIDVRELRRRLAELRTQAAPGEPDGIGSALRSRDPERIRPLLVGAAGDLASRAGDLVALLDHDGLAVDAAAALVAAGERAVTPLAQALCDPGRHVAVRRRAARVLASFPTQESARALTAALGDERFEVRVQAARALVRLRAGGRDRETNLDMANVLAAVLAELRADRAVWQKQQALEAPDEGESPFVDDLLRERADRSLEHVFTLLALTLDAESLRIAYRGLHTKDEQLRGTALEYLEGVLPPDVRAALWPRIEDDRRARPAPRPRQEVLADLYRSHPSIELRIREAGGTGSRGAS